LAEVLSVGARCLGDDAYQDAAAEIASALIARYALSGLWPSGLASHGSNPSLMLGEAGIGLSLLRQHEPSRVAPVLLIDTGLMTSTDSKATDTPPEASATSAVLN
jgi:lantibiotic modifying enzyme